MPRRAPKTWLSIYADLGVKTTDVNGALRPLEDLLLDTADGLSRMKDSALGRRLCG